MAGEASHTEVREFDAIVRSDEDVGRFDVAMHYGAAVGDGQGDGDMGGPFASSGEGDAALGDGFFDGLAFDQFHDQVGSLRRLLDAHVMNGDDGRVGELADDASLAEEMVAGITAGELRGEELDGHGTVNERVVSANNATMRACAEGFENLIAPDLQV